MSIDLIPESERTGMRCFALTSKGERCKRIRPHVMATLCVVHDRMRRREPEAEPEAPPLPRQRRLLVYGGTPERWAWECPHCGRKALEQGGTTEVEHDCPSLPEGEILLVRRHGSGPGARVGR